jgi:hypothetical protein
MVRSVFNADSQVIQSVIASSLLVGGSLKPCAARDRFLASLFEILNVAKGLLRLGLPGS